MNNTNMNPQLGHKWFTFYTKIRPWLCCFTVFPAITDFAAYSDIYFSYWWLLLSFGATIVDAILGIMVFVKSSGDYVKFVPFVKKVLLFEMFNAAYQFSVQHYVNNSFNIGLARSMFVFSLVVAYFLWYLVNVKYFEKRIIATYTIPQHEYVHYEKATIRYCSQCGNKIENDSNFCRHCGKQIIR